MIFFLNYKADYAFLVIYDYCCLLPTLTQIVLVFLNVIVLDDLYLNVNYNFLILRFYTKCHLAQYSIKILDWWCLSKCFGSMTPFYTLMDTKMGIILVSDAMKWCPSMITNRDKWERTCERIKEEREGRMCYL